MAGYVIIDEDDLDRELDLDLDDIARMTVAERYDAAIRLSLLLVEMMEKHGHREPATVLERPAR